MRTIYRFISASELAAALALAVMTPASVASVGDGWVSFFELPKGARFEYNLTRTKAHTYEGYVETWTRFTYPAKQTLATGRGTSVSYAARIAFTKYQCKSYGGVEPGEAQEGVVYLYDSTGSVVWTDNYAKSWVRSPPNSLDEQLGGKLCQEYFSGQGGSGQ